MLSFHLTEEQEAIKDMAGKFADQEIAPHAIHFDERDEFPWEIVKKLHEVGLLTAGVPEEFGGPGIDFIGQAVVCEELARGDAGVGTTVLASCMLGADPVTIGGTDDQKRRFFDVLNKGGLGAFCLTEPGAGSDAAALSMTAKLDGDVYILNGTKQFITNGGVAAYYTVFATTDKKLKHKGIVGFMVDRHSPGISIGKKENKLGIRTSDTSQVVFEDVRVPVDNRLWNEGEGFKLCMMTLDMSRPMIAALAVGNAQAAFDCALRYAKDRVAFGKPIATLQAIQFMLADMAMEIEASRLLIWKACWLKMQGKPFGLAASLSKAYAADMGMKVTTDAVQILGGYGYSKEYPAEKCMRDAKIMQLYEGTSQIQRVVIAANLLR
jgi:alkylation response protein AidB-like acyl-CoA dehydrogenase